MSDAALLLLVGVAVDCLFILAALWISEWLSGRESRRWPRIGLPIPAARLRRRTRSRR